MRHGPAPRAWIPFSDSVAGAPALAAVAVCALAALPAAPVTAQAQAQPPDAVPAVDPWATGHVLVKLKPGRSLELEAVEAFGGVEVAPTARVAPANAMMAAQIGLDRWVTVRLAPGSDPVAAVAALRALDTVEAASVDGIGGVADLIPNDPSFSQQWSMRNTGQLAGGIPGVPGADVKATGAWSLATGGRAVIVAVLDSGVSPHPDLAGRLLPGWHVPGEHDDTTDGCNSHGTHVTGIIGASGNNGIAVAGLCWDVRILPVVVVDGCSGIESWVADGITWAVDHGAEIINMSLQYSTGSQYLHDAVLYAAAAGVPMIAAAGNAGSTPLRYPAEWPETIAVGGTNNLDQRWPSSNFGPALELAAPADQVLSLAAGAGTTTKNGTSMAAPHVTGAVALMRSVNAELTEAEIRGILLETADDIDAPGFDVLTGWGRLNVADALQGAIDAAVILGDVNVDGAVDGSDLAILLGQWGPCVSCAACAADLNDDCLVDGNDLAILLGHWAP